MYIEKINDGIYRVHDRSYLSEPSELFNPESGRLNLQGTLGHVESEEIAAAIIMSSARNGYWVALNEDALIDEVHNQIYLMDLSGFKSEGFELDPDEEKSLEGGHYKVYKLMSIPAYFLPEIISEEVQNICELMGHEDDGSPIYALRPEVIEKIVNSQNNMAK